MVSDQFCWVLVTHAIDYEHRLLEDDFEDGEDMNYAAGSWNGYNDAIEQLKKKDGINAIVKAKNYAAEEDVSLVPHWIREDTEYEPNPRFHGDGYTFTSIEEERRETVQVE